MDTKRYLCPLVHPDYGGLTIETCRDDIKTKNIYLQKYVHLLVCLNSIGICRCTIYKISSVDIFEKYNTLK
jgi:hypothetical protein